MKKELNSASDTIEEPGASVEEPKKAFTIRTEEYAGYRSDGWQITFANGYTISVQFGSGTYSDRGLSTAEVAAWNKKGNWVYWTDAPDKKWVTLHKNDSDVMSNVEPEELAEMMYELSKLK